MKRARNEKVTKGQRRKESAGLFFFFKLRMVESMVQGKLVRPQPKGRGSSDGNQSCVPAVGGNGGASVVWGDVDEELSDIDPESGTGTSAPVAAGVNGNSWSVGAG